MAVFGPGSGLPDLQRGAVWSRQLHASVRARPGRVSALRVLHSGYSLYGVLYGRAGRLMAPVGASLRGQVVDRRPRLGRAARRRLPLRAPQPPRRQLRLLGLHGRFLRHHVRRRESGLQRGGYSAPVHAALPRPPAQLVAGRRRSRDAAEEAVLICALRGRTNRPDQINDYGRSTRPKLREGPNSL